jgi:hypothetical protein
MAPISAWNPQTRVLSKMDNKGIRGNCHAIV